MTFAITHASEIKQYRKHEDGQRVLIPGDPGIAYTKGRSKTFIGGNGLAIVETDSVGQPRIIAQQTKTMSAATIPFPPRENAIREWDDNADADTLLPAMFAWPDQMIYSIPIYGYADETVVSYVAATRAIACTTGFTADDYPNGALLCVYEGAGKGEINVVEDYDHTGGAAELLLICHRKFTATLDTTSKFIVTGLTSAAQAVSFMDTMDMYDYYRADVTDGVDDGDMLVYPDWRFVAELLPQGALPVLFLNNHVWA